MWVLPDTFLPTSMKESTALEQRVLCTLKALVKWSEVKSLSCVRLFATPYTGAHQAPLSMKFSRQGYWSRLPFSSPEYLPDPGIEPGSPALQADSLPSEPPGRSYLSRYLQRRGCVECWQTSQLQLREDLSRETSRGAQPVGTQGEAEPQLSVPVQPAFSRVVQCKLCVLHISGRLRLCFSPHRVLCQLSFTFHLPYCH